MPDRATGDECHRKLVVGFLGRGLEVRGLQHRLAVRVECSVLDRLPQRSRREVHAEALALVGMCEEFAVRVEALRSPLDATFPQPLVGDLRVVTRAPVRALLPRAVGRFRVRPLDEWIAVAVAELHPSRVVEENVEIRLRVSRRVDGLFAEVDRAVGVRNRPGLLAPAGGRQDDVRQPRSLCQEEVLDDDEESVLREDRANPRELR